MNKILHLISSLRPSGIACQVARLAAALPREGFEARIGLLGRDGLLGDAARAAGVAIETVSKGRIIDLPGLTRLRRLLRGFQPDVLHVWDLPALWRLRGAVGKKQGRWLVHGRGMVLGSPRQLTRLERWLIRQADGVTVYSPQEAVAWQRVGVPAAKITVLSPLLASADQDDAPPASAAAPWLAAGMRRVVCVGPLEPHKGFLDAVWSLDILKYLFSELHLLMVGAGSDRPRLERFCHDIQAADRIHFLGEQPRIDVLLAAADVVWVPSHKPAGVHVLLEAMAHGRPVIASRLPGLMEHVQDGATGLLFTPGDKAELARWTRRLLENPDEAARLGAAARHYIQEHFRPPELMERWIQLYDHP
ncbi:MAG: glycosyltransferase family 4 protein [Gemmataceae bacterium]